jgi:hypothetical protein
LDRFVLGFASAKQNRTAEAFLERPEGCFPQRFAKQSFCETKTKENMVFLLCKNGVFPVRKEGKL